MKTKTVLLIVALAAILSNATARADTPLDEARVALKAGELPKAEALLLPLTGPDSKDAAACYTLSQVRQAQHNLKESIALAERATTLDPTQADYFAQLGMALGQHMGEISFIQQAFFSGKLKRAFEKTVALDPHHVSGLIGLARFYTNAPEIAGGSLEKAQEYALRVQQIVPFLGEIEQGNIAKKSDQFAAALAHYEAAATLQPNRGETQYLCGQMLVKLDRKEEARTRFGHAVALDPNHNAAKQALIALDAKPEAKS